MFAQNMLYFEPHPPTLYSYDEPLSPNCTYYLGHHSIKKIHHPIKKTFEYDFKVFYLRYSDLSVFFPFILLELEIQV